MSEIDLATRLRMYAEDPMWADHAEVPKALLREAAAEIERLREALKPFARAAEALNEYDPEFPDDGSILRMSAEWYMRTHKAGEQLNKPLTAGDLRAVAALARPKGETADE